VNLLCAVLRAVSHLGQRFAAAWIQIVAEGAKPAYTSQLKSNAARPFPSLLILSLGLDDYIASAHNGPSDFLHKLATCTAQNMKSSPY
jgi:hypothetical protein